MTFDYRSQTVLITGASSGIGAAFAAALAARGANLVLVARNGQRLTAMAEELRRAHGVRVQAVPLDLSRPDAGPELRTAVDGPVTGLLNNAAFGTWARFADADPDRLAAEIAVDVAAPVALTAAFLPGILAHGTGFVINVAGVSAHFASPRMAVYSAAKAFVLSFTESLWADLRGTGVTAFAVCPGATDTKFTTGMGTGAEVLTESGTRTPAQVVATTLAHLERRDPGPVVIDGPANRLVVLGLRLLTRRRGAILMSGLFTPKRVTATRSRTRR